MEAKYLYRYEVRFDHWLDIPYLFCTRYKILKETKCGVWIETGKFDWNRKKFVKLKHSNGVKVRKRFAQPTEKEALKSFIMRKRRQIGILEAQLEQATLALDAGVELLKQKQEGEQIGSKETTPRKDNP